jgi:3-hydroxyisobutyrate dehydrogenase-like beta-hydroxyacid dehydrogenase
MLKARVPLVLDKPDEVWFGVQLMHKDINLARQAGTELGTPLPTAAVADEILAKASELGYGHRDIAALHEVLAKLPADTVPAR